MPGPERTSRGGSGGQFDWGTLQGDKQAAAGEFFLGRSEKCEDLWYSRSRVSKIPTAVADEEQRRERAAVQDAEWQLMQAALGLKPKASVINSLTQQQIDILMGNEPRPLHSEEKKSRKEKKQALAAVFAPEVKQEAEEAKKARRKKRKAKKKHTRKQKKQKRKAKRKRSRSRSSSASSSSSSSDSSTEGRGGASRPPPSAAPVVLKQEPPEDDDGGHRLKRHRDR